MNPTNFAALAWILVVERVEEKGEREKWEDKTQQLNLVIQLSELLSGLGILFMNPLQFHSYSTTLIYLNSNIEVKHLSFLKLHYSTNWTQSNFCPNYSFAIAILENHIKSYKNKN